MKPPKNPLKRGSNPSSNDGEHKDVAGSKKALPPLHGILEVNQSRQAQNPFLTDPRILELSAKGEEEIWEIFPKIVSPRELQSFLGEYEYLRPNSRSFIVNVRFTPNILPNFLEYIQKYSLSLFDLYSLQFVATQTLDGNAASGRFFHFTDLLTTYKSEVWRRCLFPHHRILLFARKISTALGGGELGLKRFNELVLRDASLRSFADIKNRLLLLEIANPGEILTAGRFLWETHYSDFQILRFIDYHNNVAKFKVVQQLVEDCCIHGLKSTFLQQMNSAFPECVKEIAKYDFLRARSDGFVAFSERKNSMSLEELLASLNWTETSAEEQSTTAKILEAYNRKFGYYSLLAITSVSLFLLELDSTDRNHFIFELLERSLEPVFDELNISRKAQNRVLSECPSSYKLSQI